MTRVYRPGNPFRVVTWWRSRPSFSAVVTAAGEWWRVRPSVWALVTAVRIWLQQSRWFAWVMETWYNRPGSWWELRFRLAYLRDRARQRLHLERDVWWVLGMSWRRYWQRLPTFRRAREQVQEAHAAAQAMTEAEGAGRLIDLIPLRPQEPISWN